MDPLEKVKPHKDTSYFIMLAAKERGHRVFYLPPQKLFARHGEAWGNLEEVDVHDDQEKPFTRSQPQDRPLGDMDVVMIRTDPPFDRAYSYVTLLTDLVPPTTRVVNNPQALRDWNEKLAALHFPDLTPQTLITREADRIIAFMNEVGGRITVKPVDGHGGRGIVFLEKDDTNLDQLIEFSTNGGSHLVVAQAYVPEAKEGDKRILLIDGEPIGAILRVHQEGKELNNMDAGGTAHPTALTERDLAVCDALREPLRQRGVYFAGIDLLGPYLIEINVTSPTGLQEVSRFNNQPYHHKLIEGLET
jgi:glutathione synthase